MLRKDCLNVDFSPNWSIIIKSGCAVFILIPLLTHVALHGISTQKNETEKNALREDPDILSVINGLTYEMALQVIVSNFLINELPDFFNFSFMHVKTTLHITETRVIACQNLRLVHTSKWMYRIRSISRSCPYNHLPELFSIWNMWYYQPPTQIKSHSMGSNYMPMLY